MKLYKWQKKAIGKMATTTCNNIILSAPTGAGKTRVFLTFWEEVLRKKGYKLIITAPVKSLSNQRYRELKENYVTAIETGDVRNIPNNWEILICTQEIYTNKYTGLEKIYLVMDEFHYINENTDRARTYIDSLYRSKAEYMLLCSATLGDMNILQNYVEKVSNRKFSTLEYNSRPTKLLYTQKKIQYSQIKNALVISFSYNNCTDIANIIAHYRENHSVDKKKIKDMEKEFNIDNRELLSYVEKGVAFYVGRMLPKEKLFVEKLFAEKIIDTVVGTDALSLGVNFPAKYVIFSQLEKYYNGLISKNLFEQISGRAGRKNYYSKGYVAILEDDSFEGRSNYLEDNYHDLLNKKRENLNISVGVNYGNIFKNKGGILTEAFFVSKFSQKETSFEKIRKEITYNVRLTNLLISHYSKKIPFLKKYFKEYYFDEYSIEENVDYLLRIIDGEFTEILNEIESFNELLQFRKYCKQFSKSFRRKFAVNLQILEEYISEIDETAISLIS